MFSFLAYVVELDHFWPAKVQFLRKTPARPRVCPRTWMRGHARALGGSSALAPSMSRVRCVALLLVASCDAAAHPTLPPCALRPLVRPVRVGELRAGAEAEDIQTKTAGRSNALGLCLLNRATFPSDVPRWRDLPRSWLSLQQRLRVNHVLVATTQNGKVVGSVEVHTPQYQQKQAKGLYTPEQLAKLQPYLASLAVREDMRGRGIGRKLVEAAVEAVRSSSYTGKYMLLGVEENNTAAVQLYLSLIHI